MKIHPNTTSLSYDRHIAACDWGVLFTMRKELWLNVQVAIFFATVNCTALYHIVPQCTALYSIVPHCTALYRIVPHCTALYHIVPQCTALYRIVPHCTALYRIVPHCTALCHIVPHCTTLYRIQTIAYANAIKSPKRGSREKRSPPLFLDDLYLSLWQFLCSAGAIRSSGCVDLHQCDNPKKKLYRINIDLSEVFDSS